MLLPWLHQPVRVRRRRRVHPAAAPVVPRVQQTVCRHETGRGAKSHSAPDLPPLWQLLWMDKPVRWRCRLLDGRHITRCTDALRHPAGLQDGVACEKSPASGRRWSRCYGDSDERRQCSQPSHVCWHVSRCHENKTLPNERERVSARCFYLLKESYLFPFVSETNDKS